MPSGKKGESKIGTEFSTTCLNEHAIASVLGLSIFLTLFACTLVLHEIFLGARESAVTIPALEVEVHGFDDLFHSQGSGSLVYIWIQRRAAHGAAGDSC